MSNSVYILFVSKSGKKKKDKRLVAIGRSNAIRVELLAGTLLVECPILSDVLLDTAPQSAYYESIDTADTVEIVCAQHEVSVLSSQEFDLLRPIPTCVERLEVFRNKEWLQEGSLIRTGDTVFVKIKGHQSELPGIVRYRGNLPDLPGLYFGIELTENKGEGTCDGLYQKRRYFTTALNSAVFCPLHKVRKRRESWQKSDRARASQGSPLYSASAEMDDVLRLGDRVMWPSDNGNEFGTVRWIGILPEDTSGEKTVGVEFDNPIGTGTGKYRDHRLFYTKQGHASLVPLMGLIKADDQEVPTQSADRYHPERELDQEFVKEQEELLRQFEGRGASAAQTSAQPLQELNSQSSSSIVTGQRSSSRPTHASDRTFDYTVKSRSEENAWHKVSHVEESKENGSEVVPSLTQLGLRDAVAGMADDSGMNPVYLMSRYQESCERKQSSTSSSSSSVPVDPDLVVGSMVEVLGKPPRYGVIRWIGKLDDQSTKITAGLEMEEEISAGSDGTFLRTRYFTCAARKGFFVPLNKCRKDKRFQSEPKDRSSHEEFGSFETPDVDGDESPPEVTSEEDLRVICGKSRGIQGHHNSCYLDASLFAMFYFTTVFDFIFNQPPRPNSLPDREKVQKVLKEGIVNPLRKFNYVRADKVLKLRELLDKLGTIPGMLGEEKDPEEFLNALLSQVMNADPLLHLSSGEHTFFYQLFIEKDEKLLYPTTQILLELSSLQGDVKLKEVPACLILQMPRFGKEYKMYRRIIPSLELDITDILEAGIRECIVCGGLATYECKNCYLVHGQGLNTTAYCEQCLNMSHQHKKRQGHKPRPLLVPPEFIPIYNKMRLDASQSSRQNGEPNGPPEVGLPREKMELFAVVCIQTSHYVSFVKCGMGKDAPWVFFDSMADRMGEQGGYNIPEVQHVPELSKWLSEKNFQDILNVDDDRGLPEHMRRLLCDAYMVMYQSPSVMMFR